MSKKKHPDDTSPAKLLVEELDSLRKTFALLLKSYAARINADLDAVREVVGATEPVEQIPKEHLHDLREMLSVARDLKIKADKGRRRDLKKVESVIEELQELSSHW